MGRILCLDHGAVRMGVALSVTDGLAVSRDYIDVRKGRVFDEIIKLVSEDECTEIIVGLPISLNGQDTQETLEVKAFVEKLKTHIDISITLWDERLSSYTAENLLLERNVSREDRKEMRDSLSAQLILQSYLDCRV